MISVAHVVHVIYHINIDKYSALQDLTQTPSDNKARTRLGKASVVTICDNVTTRGILLDSDPTISDHVTHLIQRALSRLRGLYMTNEKKP